MLHQGLANRTITGAGGIVGTGIRAFLRETHELVLLSRREITDLQPGETAAIGDVCDPELLRKAMVGCDGVIILAASYGLNISFEETLNVNYRATVSIMDIAAATGVKSVIFASSNHGWGFHQKASAPLPNTAPVRPDGWYGISKIWGEAVMAYYADAYGLTTSSLRIGNTDAVVFDERRTHMWMSFRDMAGLMNACLARRTGTHEAFFATVDGMEPYFDNAGVAAQGYTPEDHPKDHFAKDFNPETCDHDRIGGPYVGANMFTKAPS